MILTKDVNIEAILESWEEVWAQRWAFSLQTQYNMFEPRWLHGEVE